jgi:hypothetical protein
MNKSKKLLSVLALTALVPAAAYSATQSVTANIAFDTALTITKVNDIEFGTVKALTTGTYTIDTADAVTAGGSGVWLYGTPASAEITIAGSSTQTLNIGAGNYSVSNNVTPSAATCDYNGGGEVDCNHASLNTAAAPGAGKTLMVGVLATVGGGAQAAGTTAAPTFDITIVYN